MQCPRCGTSMQVIRKTHLSTWRLAVGGASIVGAVVLFIAGSVIAPSDGGTATVAAAAVAQARVFHGVGVVLLLAGGALLWLGQSVTYRCPSCGYACKIAERDADKVERDQRMDQLKQGATGMQRLGMWVEQRDVDGNGLPTSMQGYRSRSSYERMGRVFIVAVVLAVAIIVVAGIVGALSYVAGS